MALPVPRTTLCLALNTGRLAYCLSTCPSRKPCSSTTANLDALWFGFRNARRKAVTKLDRPSTQTRSSLMAQERTICTWLAAKPSSPAEADNADLTTAEKAARNGHRHPDLPSHHLAPDLARLVVAADAFPC